MTSTHVVVGSSPTEVARKEQDMSTELLKRKAAAATSFNAIGKKNGSAPPDNPSNTFGIAYELFIADHLRSIANARYEEAKASAVEAGVLQDTYTAGTHVAYDSPELSVVVTKNKDSVTFDKTKAQNYITKKYGEVATKAMAKEATGSRNGATTVKVAVK